MSDEELVERLRGVAKFSDLGLCPIAADRIEALTVEREWFEEEWVSAVDKLNKAVEGLRFGVDLIEGDSIGHEWKKGQADFRRMARAIIAEIENSEAVTLGEQP
jgi:hypothetical protein